MSYILEALRRSQAERERGQVPGLHSPSTAAAPGSAARRPATTLWLAAGAGLLVLALLALWLSRAPGGGAAPVAAAPAVVNPAAVAAVPVTPAAPAPLPVVVSAPPVAAPPPERRAAAPASPALPAVPAVTPAAVMPAPAPPSAAPGARLAPLALAELTAEQRREWPPLVMGGSIWSDSALSRFVIINGQVVREGEAAAKGMVLERIGPKTVTVRWRDLRVELPLQ